MKLIDDLIRGIPEQERWHPSWALAYRKNGGNNIYYSSNKPISLAEGFEYVSREQYEAALAASKQPEWNGEGRPPVGLTCEHRPGDGTTENEWEVVTVLGISERPGGTFTDFWLRKEDGSSYIVRNAYRFRPIRTEAERKREEAIAAMRNFATNYNNTAVIHAIEQVYDSIAAGKIPHITLK
ncbi:hypothetical protein [Pantoea ananatis]|uniref:hypothetical protein n=1 Tax=Pantoea ananas TaxID=553 RepID=UPI001B300C8B|nr:hypothetical protein [Pantoea ananatis]